MRSSARFDPASGRIEGVRTLYDEFHEWAHVDQMVRGTPLWRLSRLFAAHPHLRWSGIGGLIVCAVELEALLMARREMRACGLWAKDDEIEAVAGLASYCWRTISDF